MRKLIPVIVLLLISCEVMVDVDIPLEKQQVTVNSFFNPDSLWTVQLSLNRHVLDSQPFQEIDDAQVILYEGLDPVDTLTNIGRGVFRSDNQKPEKERTYSIRVSVPGNDELFASSSVPLPATITGVDVYESGNSMIRVRIRDDATAKNYYELYASVENEFFDNNSKQIRTSYYQTSLTSEHPAISNESSSPTANILFTDVFFNGNEAELTFKTSGGGFSNSAAIQVVVRSLSEDGYNYLTTASLNHENSGDPFAQPINVYNNIENGFGIFAGYSASIFTTGTPRPIITAIDPPAGKAGDHVVIAGENFLAVPVERMSVSFQTPTFPAPAQIVSATDSRVEVIVPNAAITGKILVRSGRLGLSNDDFVIAE